MPAISAELREFIQYRLPDGLDDQEVADIAAKVALSAKPVDTLNAILGQYGDTFTLDGAKAFNVAATIVGDRDLGQLGTVFQATKESITGVQGTISGLSKEISRLESENTTQAAEADRLVSQINSRKSEIESSRRKKRRIGLFGAMMGMPAVAAVSLVKTWDDDSRLKVLNSSLTDAQSRRAEIGRQMDSYKATKSTLGGKLEKLQRAEAGLTSTLGADKPDLPKDMAQVADAAVKLERRQKLLKNLNQQVSVLEEIRDAAKSVGVNLDQLIQNLYGEVANAEKMVAESEKSLLELVKIATGPDPDAAATKWLNKAVAKRTAQVLGALKLDIKKYVGHLVDEAFPDGGDAAKQLRKQLITKLTAEITGG